MIEEYKLRTMIAYFNDGKNGINYGYNNSDDGVSVTSNREKLKNAMTDAQKADKGFFQLKQMSAYTGKKLLVSVYASGQTGSTIRNAVTGEKQTGYKVGNYDEDLFFSVSISSGHQSLTKLGRRDPITLFFDNPEQYERHMHVKLPVDTKLAWNHKYNVTREYYEER
jgi:hypothetical protein